MRVVGFLQKYDGAITALATVAIVILTMVYVLYSKKQWETMSRQLDEMQKSDGLQKQVAKIAVRLPVPEYSMDGALRPGRRQKTAFHYSGAE